MVGALGGGVTREGPLTHFEDGPLGEQAADEGHSVRVLAEPVGPEVQQEDLV